MQEASGRVRQGRKVIQLMDDQPVKVFTFPVTKTVDTGHHIRVFYFVYVCQCVCVCICCQRPG